MCCSSDDGQAEYAMDVSLLYKHAGGLNYHSRGKIAGDLVFNVEFCGSIVRYINDSDNPSCAVKSFMVEYPDDSSLVMEFLLFFQARPLDKENDIEQLTIKYSRE